MCKVLGIPRSEYYYQINKKKNSYEEANEKLDKEIKENNIKSVICSQICDGWIDLIKKIKEIAPDTKIKVIWHGNCYEYFSDFTWNLNKEVMNLYKENKIDSFAFVRSTMYEFYKKCGFKVEFVRENKKNPKLNKYFLVKYF